MKDTTGENTFRVEVGAGYNDRLRPGGPVDHVTAVGVSPADTAPCGCVGIPLIPEMVETCTWIVGRTTWIIHPAVRTEEMRTWSPLVEKLVAIRSVPKL